MDKVLVDLYPLGIFCYIDDIVIYDNDASNNLEKLETVLQRLREQGLYVQLPKCTFLQNKAKILGHIVSYEGIMPDKDKVKAVWDSQPPKNKKELRSFLGLASYLRKFIPHFSKHAAPLNQLLKKNVKYDWTEECNDAFEWLRSAITDRVMLSAPRSEGIFVIACDASDYGVGAALMQLQDKELAILEFASKSLSDVQRR